MNKENILQELNIIKNDLLTGYKRKYYSEVFIAEKNLLDKIIKMIKTEQTHPLYKED